MGLLNGKTAVITGSSRGLGLAIAQAFALEGANVVLAARTESTLRRAVDTLKEQGVQAVGFVCDISNAAEVEALADKAVEVFGKLDIWVNNAGIGAPYGPTFSSFPKYFMNVVDTNIKGVYNGSSAAMSHFISQGSGKLINLLGRGADGPVPFQNAYASSKAWIKTFTRTLAKEYAGRGIEILAYNPGLVLTEMLTLVDVVPGFEKKVLPLNTIIRLWANPPEIPAKKVVWLASSATDGKSGQIVNFMTPWFMIRGLAKELVRVIARKPSRLPTITIHVVEK